MTPIDLKAEMEKDGVTGNPAAYCAMKRIPWGNLKDYYNETFECPNCGHAKHNIVYIRKGVLVKDIGPILCKNCGCQFVP